MADDRPAYRPRRAFGENDRTPDRSQTPEAELPGRFTEDEARPIFREDASDADASTVRTPSAGTGTPSAGGSQPADRIDKAEKPEESEKPADETAEPTDETAEEAGAVRTSRLNFTPRARPADQDATTVLPRTAAREGRGGPPPVDEDVEERPHRLGSRARLALLVGAVALVVVVGLLVGRVVLRSQPSGAGSPGPDASSDAGSPSAAALLDDASMLTADGARAIDGKRTWTVGGTARGPLPAGSGPACLGSDPLEGAPTAQQTISRTLTSSGKNAPGALHVAQAYATPEDATQAFSVTAKALGTCSVTGDWLSNGRAVTGVGDESVAAAVRSDADGQTSLHWVVVSRTGRAIDLVDASTPGTSALNVNSVTAALASAVGTQCQAAGGTCPTAVSTKDAPPPPGGDEPGFLATGDLPPAGSGTAPWVGTPVEAPSEDFTGSQCESVNWATTAATSKNSRVYLLQDVPGIFGLNEIVLTEKDAGTAAKLVDKIQGDWKSCKERKLTATVDSPTKVTGVGADGSTISGWTTEIDQKAGSTTTRFRVGIAASGDKVAFVFLNPQKGLDISKDDWNVVAVRAVQRQTQQS